MSEDKLLKELSDLIEELGWDYDRMSQSGKETYDEICSLMAKISQ